MNSRRAAEPMSSHAHGSGAGPWVQIEKSISRATTASWARLSTRPRSREGTPARSQGQEQLRQVRDRPQRARRHRRRRGSCDAARSGCGRPGRAGRRPTAPRRRARRRAPPCAPRPPRACRRSPRSRAGAPAPSAPAPGRTRGRARRPRSRPSATAARTSASVRMPMVSSGIATSSAWRCSSPSRWAAVRRVSVGSAYTARAHDGRHRRGADVVQPVDRMPGAGEALAQRPGHVGHARLGGQHPPGGVGREQHAARRLARAHGERGRHPGEQRRMPEALPGLEHLDDLARVHHVHRPGDDDPQTGGRWAVLDQQHGARLVLVDGRLRGQLVQLLGRQRVERRVPGQECVQVLHVRHRNCVRIVPCEPTATCQGKPSNDQRTWRAHAGRNDRARTF